MSLLFLLCWLLFVFGRTKNDSGQSVSINHKCTEMDKHVSQPSRSRISPLGAPPPPTCVRACPLFVAVSLVWMKSQLQLYLVT